MSALQARPAIQVAPVVFVTQTVVPIVARAAAARRALRRHAARRRAAVGLARAARRGRRAARALAAAARADGGRARQPRRAARRRALCAPSQETIRSSPRDRRGRAVELDHQHVAGAHRALRQRARRRSGAAPRTPASRRRCGRAPAGRPTGRRAAAGSRSGGAGRARAPASAARRACAPSATARSRALPAATSSPSARSWRSVARDGTPPSSAKDTWMPRAASSCGHARDLRRRARARSRRRRADWS